MVVAYIIYIIVLTAWATISYLGIQHVLKHRIPGDAVPKIVITYVVLSVVIILASFLVMLSIDWGELF